MLLLPARVHNREKTRVSNGAYTVIWMYAESNMTSSKMNVISKVRIKRSRTLILYTLSVVT